MDSEAGEDGYDIEENNVSMFCFLAYYSTRNTFSNNVKLANTVMTFRCQLNICPFMTWFRPTLFGALEIFTHLLMTWNDGSFALKRS